MVQKLREAGLEVRVFSGGKAASFLVASGVEVEDLVDGPSPAVSGGEMKRASVWYLRSWLALKRSSKATEALARSFGPDLVVCDEEFSGMVMARKLGLRSVLVSDELELGFAKGWLAKAIEKRVDTWYKDVQLSAEAVLVPDFGRDAGNVRYVEPIVRKVTKTRSEVFQEVGLPESAKMVLFSMSGSGIGDYLLKACAKALPDAGVEGARLVVTGNRKRVLPPSAGKELGVVMDNQNFVAAADLVVSTAGKSTIDEAASCGTPVIAVPIRNHSEQERNAAPLGFTADDAERLAPLIRERTGRRGPAKSYAGAENAAKLIASLA